MGELAIRKPADEAERRAFTSAVLEDIRTLEALVARGGIEAGVRRMGVEQEMFLVDQAGRPAPCAGPILERLGDPRFTHELARFNLEANFDPQLLGGGFLATLEQELADAFEGVTRVAAQEGAAVLLTGILPTLAAEDLGSHNLTAELRYHCLDEAVRRGRDAITLLIDGIDQYEGAFDSVVLEGANTSLQLHLQVTAEESARQYNLMQLITAPLLAAATNSPVLLGHRLWHETRIAVFERALDGRTGAQLARGHPTRVSFGDAWLEDSVLELFRDNVARFPVLLVRDAEVQASAVQNADAPQLAALSLHNGTVWRWNRPCYGAAGGVAHLRIENRVLPAGPTILDEVANAAFFYGMMAALPDALGDVAARMPFADAKANFLAAARRGLGADFAWLDGRRVGARELILQELLPAARDGLAGLAVPSEQIERYLGVLEARVVGAATGSNWLLGAGGEARERPTADTWRRAVSAMLEGQRSGLPVHEWPPLQEDVSGGATPAQATERSVATVMTRDLFTLRPDEVLDLAGSVMEWKHVRHIPVESERGELLGVLTARELLRHGARRDVPGSGAVRELMRTDVPRVAPELPLARALERMLETDLGCLLVVAQDRLLGIVTERDLLVAFAEQRSANAP